MQTTSSTTSGIPLGVLRDDVRTLAKDLTSAAQQHLLEPALRAAGFTGDDLDKKVAQAKETFNQQRVRTSEWVASNPMTAIGVAAGVGVLLAAFSGLRRA